MPYRLRAPFSETLKLILATWASFSFWFSAFKASSCAIKSAVALSLELVCTVTIGYSPRCQRALGLLCPSNDRATHRRQLAQPIVQPGQVTHRTRQPSGLS